MIYHARHQHCHVPGKLNGYHEAVRAQVAAALDMTIAELRTRMLATTASRSATR